MPDKSLEDFRYTVPQELLTKPFEEYTLKDAQEIIKSRASTHASTALSFYNGDHWQEGDGWVGPRYPSGHELYQESMAAIKSSFVSHNVVAEMVDRHVSGVLARELHWSLTTKATPKPVLEADPITQKTIERPGEPASQDQALITEGQDALVEWWNSRNVLETLKRALSGLLNIRRAPMRFSIPPGLRDEQGNLPSTDLPGAFEYLYLDAMGYDDQTQDQMLPSATVWENKGTRQHVGIFTYKELVQDGDRSKEEERAELCYVNRAGNTVLVIINSQGIVGAPVELPLGRRILLYEMQRKAISTVQVLSQQRSINKTLSMKDRNDTQGGYLERIMLNVKWPTEIITNAQGEQEEVATPMRSGPGIIQSLQGTVFTDENGVVHPLTPSVQFRDPVPAITFIDSADHSYAGMLKEAKQLHYASKDLAISGESRKQSRDSYTKDLQDSANVVESCVRWILETALSEAAYLAGRAGAFDGLRAYVQAKIDPGPVSPDDMRVSAEMKDRGLWDWETAVSATGVDDVDAIKQRLDQEQAEQNTKLLAFAEQARPAGGDEDEDEDDEDGEPLADRAARLQARAGVTS